MKLSHDDYYRGYVLGFLFSPDLRYVVLTKKSRYDLINGIGGEVISGGSHRTAIWKHFSEQAGWDYDDWQYLKSIPANDGLPCHIWYGVGELHSCIPPSPREVGYAVTDVVINNTMWRSIMDHDVPYLVKECLEKLK